MQLELFKPLPPWWTPDDVAVCASYHAEEARQIPFTGDPETWADEEFEAFWKTMHPRMNEYVCRRCHNWTSDDGERGVCEYMVRGWQEDYEAPEPAPGEFPKMHDTPPDRAKCMTGRDSMCEEWYPRG